MYVGEGFRGRQLLLVTFTLLVIVAVSACATRPAPVDVGLAVTDQILLQSLPGQAVSYQETVRPVLQRRCVVCHGCYDAPCQLKLSSPEGIERGASKDKVYDGTRFTTAPPTRLYLDANSTDAWRGKGFHAVLNEGGPTPIANLEQSVMYKMLRLKQINPQARVGHLSDAFDLSLNRPQTCPTLDEFDRYAAEFPRQGMPFGLPNLDDDEYRVLVHWLAQGAPMPLSERVAPQVAAQIERWESFLNGTGNKQRLMSRYLYEHLFLGHIHFEGSGAREFYRLVRSATPPGQTVDEIATLRPYDDPGRDFFYRLIRYPGDIVAKSHLVYEFSDRRMARYRALFLDADYQVAELPSWDPELTANPFKVFRDIPPISRYRFLLDDARYFIEGFIKGPVCRGTIALNVIEDRFWVTFVAPEDGALSTDPAFLEEVSEYLATPAVLGDGIPLLGVWGEYRRREQRYNERRFEVFATLNSRPIGDAVASIWDGGGSNPNAALTVFRHYDSASVRNGLIGDYPETAWIIDYPLLERIHYLLVAGFNVFGNLSHQLHTRLYMDFLRMEGEDLFLSFLPASHRQSIRDGWYQGMRQDRQRDLGDIEPWLGTEVVTAYQTDDPQRELYDQLSLRLAKVLPRHGISDGCPWAGCAEPDADPEERRVDRAMQLIAELRGEALVAFPDVTFVRVRRGGDPDRDLAYTVIRDKAYKNVTSIFDDAEEPEQRDFSNDALTVVDWLEGAYPNFFFSVDIGEIDRFTARYAALRHREELEMLISRYGIRRTNAGFWETADWFQDQYLREQPIRAGLFDLNRYYAWR